MNALVIGENRSKYGAVNSPARSLWRRLALEESVMVKPSLWSDSKKATIRSSASHKPQQNHEKKAI